MRKTTLTIIKKEFYRFFRDWKMLIGAILLPAVLTYAMYTLIGSSTFGAMIPDENYSPKCYVQNMPESFEEVFAELNFDTTEATDLQSAKDLVAQKEADLLVIFPDDFDLQLQNLNAGSEAPDIEAYFNSTSTTSDSAYGLFVMTIEQLEDSMFNVVDINRENFSCDLASEADFASKLVAYMLPMMLITALFTGCMSFSMESIAGEKERGTIATLLVTPASRTSIVIGKVISLSFFALLAGLSEFAGCMLALPQMSDSLIDMNVYGLGEYAALLAVIIATVLMLVAVLSIISTYAKNVKEATAMGAPIMILAMFASFLPSLPIDFSAIGWKFVPVFNSILCLTDIFAFDYSAAGIAVTCVSNLVYAVAMVFALTKMFNSEKIMFSK